MSAKKTKAQDKPVLTPRQQRFVDEYLIDLNATQAAVRAGYSKKTANEQGAQLLAKLSVREAVDKAKGARADRVRFTSDEILLELRRIALADPRKFFNADGSLKRIEELDDDTAATLASVEVIERKQNIRKVKDPDEGEDQLVNEVEQTKKIRLWDKVAALEKAMKHLGLLKERIEHTGTVQFRMNA